MISLDNNGNQNTIENVENKNDPVCKAIKIFKFHPNILLIFLLIQCHQRSYITPIYKKKDPQAKENYRPVSVLQYFQKLFFERLIQKPMYSLITDYLSDFL